MSKQIKIYSDSIDGNVLNQFHNAMEQDFSIKGALMPDAHFGYSLPIGGVVATEGVVLPSWVGFDIGCFTGDTKIPLLDGTESSLLDLYKSNVTNFPVYSIDTETGEYKIGIADKVKLTRKNTSLVSILLDNGERITCTPDHKFLLKSKKYLEAGKLQYGDSLFPFSRRNDEKGYEYLGNRGYITTTRALTQSGLIGDRPDYENGSHIHHKDHNPSNNLPENLEFVEAKKHMREHAILRDTFRSEDFKKKKRKTIAERGYYFDSKHFKTKQIIGRTNIKKYMEENPEHYKEVVKRNGFRGGRFFSKKNSNPDMILKQKVGRLHKILDLIGGKLDGDTYEKARKQVYNGIRFIQASVFTTSLGYSCLSEYYDVKYNSLVSNHRVISVTPLDRKEDVYCITVNKYHNFALSSGVIVHNCGMCALNTSFKKADVIKNRDKIFQSIYRSIPTGFNHNKKDGKWDYKKYPYTNKLKEIFNKNGLKQLGSLGGGNHFIEIGYDEHDFIWIIIHSGSRGIGHATASHYMKLASGDGKVRDGHYWFDVKSAEGIGYIVDLNFCLEFALENRKEMMRRIIDQINYYCEGEGYWDELINRNHNHAEEKDGLWIHRKGATHAEEGMRGVIPGNMRDGSFIVEGKGNKESLYSSSHGAGRILSRKQAKVQIGEKDFIETMKGITAKVNKNTIDESPFVYKNIFEVMELQKDLVDVINYIKPLINVKG